MVTAIGSMLKTPPIRLQATPLVVDATGDGAPVVDMFRQAGLGPTPVTITAGFTVKRDDERGGFMVPKRDLVTTKAVLLEQRRLLIPPSLPLADLLTRELQAFKRKVTPVGSDSYAAGLGGSGGFGWSLPLWMSAGRIRSMRPPTASLRRATTR